MTSKRHIKLAKMTALITFIIGTVIFGLYYLTSSSQMLLVGYIFILIAVIVNLIILILTLLKSNRNSNNDSKNSKELLKGVGLLLLNIPIGLVYAWMTLFLLGHMRITFRNDTSHELTEINILGCEIKNLKELEPKESATVWIKIKGDCSITMDYIVQGKNKSETVVGYVTSLMGRKTSYNIGGEK